MVKGIFLQKEISFQVKALNNELIQKMNEWKLKQENNKYKFTQIVAFSLSNLKNGSGNPFSIQFRTKFTQNWSVYSGQKHSLINCSKM